MSGLKDISEYRATLIGVKMILKRVFEGAYSLHYAECKVEANFHAPFVLGGEYKNCMFISKNGRLGGYYSLDEMHRLRLASYALLMNKKYVKTLLEETKKACRGIVQTTKLIVSEDLSKLSGKELAVRLEIFRKEHWLNQVYFLSSMPTCTHLLEKEMKIFIEREVKDPRKSQEYAIALTTTSEKTALNDEEEEYGELLMNLMRQGRKIRAETFIQFKREIQKYPPIIDGLNRLLDRYRWIPTQERNAPYEISHYLKRIYYDLQRTEKELVKETRFHKRKFKEFGKKRKKVEEMLKPPERIRYIAKIIRDMAHIRMEVRLARTESDFLGEKIREEVGRRLGIDSYDVEFYTTKELTDILLGMKKISLETLKERRKYYLWEIKDGVKQIHTGEEARRVEKESIDENLDNTGEDISGLAASPGKVRGTVKIISPLSHKQFKDCEEMKQDEILVTGQTRPHLMVAVRKAKAIVTDEGGMSSHSALVSREYKIPCIVGTHNATKMLDDGDLIEVDAYKGSVKIIQKAGGKKNGKNH
jgi:phosphohistidine swiveling domain-containing protein